MTLSELVINYRKGHSLSQRQFAQQCGFSNGFVSMLEKNVNPNTGLPLTPSLPTLQKLAAGMGLSLDALFSLVDIPVDMSIPNNRSEDTWTAKFCRKVAEEIEGADPTDAYDAGIDLDRLQNIASGEIPVNFEVVCDVAMELGISIDELVYNKAVREHFTDGLTELDFQLINLIKGISPDQKRFLLAQLQTFVNQQKPPEETPF